MAAFLGRGLAPGRRCCNLPCDVHSCPPCLLHGALMRPCLQKGCVHLGKVIGTPGTITTCRLSRPGMPMIGPRPRAVPGCVCAAGRGGGVVGALVPAGWCGCTFQSQTEILCVRSIVLGHLVRCFPRGRRKHGADQAMSCPGDPETTPSPAVAGRAGSRATEKQRMGFSIRSHPRAAASARSLP